MNSKPEVSFGGDTFNTYSFGDQNLSKSKSLPQMKYKDIVSLRNIITKCNADPYRLACLESKMTSKLPFSCLIEIPVQ